MRTLFVFLGVLVGASSTAQPARTAAVQSGGKLPADVMPFAEVVAGMQGYMLTNVGGMEPIRVPIRVVAIETTSSAYPAIHIELLTQINGANGIHGGMSGSPVYVNDRLIGSLARTKEGLTSSRGWLTPAELIIRNLPRTREDRVGVLRSTPVIEAFKPGSTYIACSVWGDFRNCLGGTVTYRLGPSRWYIQGHGSGRFESTGLEQGHTIAAVWKARVRALVGSVHHSSLSMERDGDIAGIIVWDNTYGGILVTSHVPRRVPVSLSMHGYGDHVIKKTLETGHSPMAGVRITTALKELASRYMGVDECARADVSIDVAELKEPIVFRDVGPGYHRPDGHDALVYMLNHLFVNARPRPTIRSVQVRLENASSCDMLQTQEAQVRLSADGLAAMTVRVTRTRDYRSLTRTLELPGSWNPLIASTLRIKDGVNIQNMLLAQLPLAQAVEALREVHDRSAAYITYFPSNSVGPPAPGDLVPEGWQIVQREINIIMKLDTGGPPVMSQTNN